MKCIQNRDGKFVLEGAEIRLKGFGIGSWLNLEHYMVGMPTPDRMIKNSFAKIYGDENAKRFWNDFQDFFIKQEDFDLIKESGANFLRVPFNYRLLVDDNNKDVWKESGFSYLTNLVNLCEKNKIYLLLDMHTAPGGQNPDWHSDNNTGMPQFWEYQVFRREITKIWGEIARRYAKQEYLFGYDLLNEPAMCQWDALNEFYKETIDEIRKYDENHLIVLGGDHFAMDFTGLEQFKDEQICLGFHFYPICWYPRLSEKSCSREEFNDLFRKVLDQIVEQCKKYGKPYFCGEYGFEKDTTEEDILFTRMTDTMELFEEYKLNWVIWTYKDLGDMGLASIREDSKWKKFVNEIGKSWSQDIEKRDAARILGLCRELGYQEMDEEMEYKLSFRVRAMLFELQSAYILEKELSKIPWTEMKTYPQAFQLDNCEIDQKFLHIMKEITKR